MSEPLLRVEDLSVRFEVRPEGLLGRRRGVVHAVDRVSFEIPRGETLGLIGESGSGKSTTGRALLRRVEPDAGRIEFKGVDVTHLQGEPLRRLRRHMQMIFQDPYGSLNPRLRVGEIVAEPLLVHGVAEAAAAGERVAELLALVGLPPDAAERHPDAFSGGQRQRIGIARALALEPELIVADEPVSALDVSVRAQVINLLEELQARLGLTYLFIGHDLAVVRRVAHRIAIMYSGRIVELAASRQVYEEPRHPYTRALLAAIPSPGRRRSGKDRRSVVIGEPPDPIAPPPGCRFHPRCPYRQPSRCADEDPALRALAPGQAVACHYAEEIASGAIRARIGDGEQPPRPRPQTPPRQGATTNRSDIEHDQND